MRELLRVGVFVLTLSGCASHVITAGVGAYSGSVKSVSGDQTGAVGLLAPFSFPLGAKIRLQDSVPLTLGLDYTPLSRKSPETMIASTYILTRALLNFGASDSLFAFGVGPSLAFHRQSGSGTAVELPNGNSTAVFATPNYSVTTSVYGLNLALDLRFGSWILTNEFFWQNFMKRSRWNLAYLASLQYQFGGL